MALYPEVKFKKRNQSQKFYPNRVTAENGNISEAVQVLLQY